MLRIIITAALAMVSCSPINLHSCRIELERHDHVKPRSTAKRAHGSYQQGVAAKCPVN